MAFVPFYINAAASGASDLNSGSTTAAPTHTYSGGTFVRSTNTFTVASGNPSTDGFVAAGDYVSVYTTSGRTVATFVMKVDSTTSTTIVGSASGIVYGVNTTVSETANASSLTIGGSWSTLLPIFATLTAGGLGTFTVPQSTKVNVKQATYTLAASPTCSIAGATTAPFWVSGYNASPGDLDNDTTNSLTKPAISINSTFFVTNSGVYSVWSGFAVSGSRTGTIWSSAVSGNTFYSRMRFTNTSSNPAAIAFTTSSNTAYHAFCYFNTPSTATTTGVVSVGAGTTWFGCVADGGGLAGWNTTNSGGVWIQCVALNNVTNGILATTGVLRVINCTFYNATNGIQWSSTPAANGQPGQYIVGCLFSGATGGTAMTNGINNASGTNTSNIYRACNDYYNVTNAEVGMGDNPAWFGQTDSAFPLVSATNLTPVFSSNAINHGFAGIFENQSYSSYPPIGAVEPQHTQGIFIQ